MIVVTVIVVRVIVAGDSRDSNNILFPSCPHTRESNLAVSTIFAGMSVQDKFLVQVGFTTYVSVYLTAVRIKFAEDILPGLGRYLLALLHSKLIGFTTY
jgi:hypothetical protein